MNSTTPPEGVSPSQLSFELAEMKAAHLDAVVAIESAVFTNPWQKGDFEFSLAREGSLCKVALRNDRLIGYTVGFLIGHEFHLADFAIHPGFQNAGLGRQLLTTLMALLDARTVHVITLEVRASNIKAIGLYKRMDFQTLAIRRGYYSRPREDAFVMLKPLRGSLSDWVGRALNLPVETPENA